jgi:hypothetical protein
LPVTELFTKLPVDITVLAILSFGTITPPN